MTQRPEISIARRPLHRYTAVVLLGMLVAISGACASRVKLDAPKVSKEEEKEAVEALGTEMLLDLVEQKKRLVDIEYRLTKAVARQCGTMRRPHAGVLVGTRSSFDDAEIRPLAEDVLTDSEELTILHLVPGGPFARAGFELGDHILALDGGSVRSEADLTKFLLESATRRSVEVTFSRGTSAEQEASVTLEPTCPIRLGLASDALLIPWQTERLLVRMPLGLLRFAKDDSTLAVAAAHQIAHALFDLPDDDALKAEKRADRNGLRLAAAAGYDIQAAASYWEEVAIEYPVLIGEAGPRWRPLAWKQGRRAGYDELWHPDIARRMESIRAIAAEYAAK
jgi:membrane-associated protease RseP (regulator of RpoE activity)